MEIHRLTCKGDEVEVADARVPCPECDEILPSEAALIVHKAEMMQNGKGHLICTVCKMSFRTAEGCQTHMRMRHPAEQDLSCPACHKKFHRMAGLIGHLELNDGCSGVNTSYMARKRLQKVSRVRALKAMDDSGKPQTKHDGDYGAYLGIREVTPIGLQNSTLAMRDGAASTASEQEAPSFVDDDAASTTAENNSPSVTDQLSDLLICDKSDASVEFVLDTKADIPKDSSQAYRQGDSKQTDLLTTANLAALNVGSAGSWMSSKSIYSEPHPKTQRKAQLEAPLQALLDVEPVAKPVAKPATETVKPVNEPAPKPVLTIVEDDDDLLDLHHPDHPRFRAANYYVPVLGKFKCPRLGCNKSFKAGNALVGHLYSPAHSKTNFTCPQCSKHFKSLTALVQHSESQGVRCKVKDSRGYRQYIDQMTGGVIDNVGSHADATPRYVVTNEVKSDVARGETAAPPGDNTEKLHGGWDSSAWVSRDNVGDDGNHVNDDDGDGVSVAPTLPAADDAGWEDVRRRRGYGSSAYTESSFGWARDGASSKW